MKNLILKVILNNEINFDKVLVVNDASKQYFEILNSLSKQNEKINVISNVKNLGQERVWNLELQKH